MSSNKKIVSPASILTKYKQYLSSKGSIKSTDEAVWFAK